MNKGWRILKWIVFGLFAVSIFGWLTMLLWNWLVPELFSGHTINFWQSLGLLLLVKMLFWGVSGKGCHACHYQGTNWKQRFYGKLSRMSPEDRESFRGKMREKWCPTEKAPPSSNEDA